MPRMDGKALYRRWRGPAEWLKVFLQMLVGVGAISIIVASLINDLRHDTSALQVTQHALGIIAASLAVAASLELAYTLFTDGPDEVIDPLLMGISATMLYLVSSLGSLTWTSGIAIALFAVTLAVLFAVRQRFIDKHDVEEGQNDRRLGRRRQVEDIPGAAGDADAVLDLLEIAEFAWHDRYEELGPPQSVINELLDRPYSLRELVRAVRATVDYHGVRHEGSQQDPRRDGQGPPPAGLAAGLGREADVPAPRPGPAEPDGPG